MSVTRIHVEVMEAVPIRPIRSHARVIQATREILANQKSTLVYRRHVRISVRV